MRAVHCHVRARPHVVDKGLSQRCPRNIGPWEGPSQLEELESLAPPNERKREVS